MLFSNMVLSATETGTVEIGEGSKILSIRVPQPFAGLSTGVSPVFLKKKKGFDNFELIPEAEIGKTKPLVLLISTAFSGVTQKKATDAGDILYWRERTSKRPQVLSQIEIMPIGQVTPFKFLVITSPKVGDAFRVVWNTPAPDSIYLINGDAVVELAEPNVKKYMDREGWQSFFQPDQRLTRSENWMPNMAGGRFVLKSD